ncbi:MAG: phage baseplate protein [Bryobacteraceae bacterium]
MWPLAPKQILAIWEQGNLRCLTERAYMLLAAALPEAETEQLLSMSVGKRDDYLLRLRAATIADRIEGYAECTRCGERLSFSVRTNDIVLMDSDFQSAEHHREIHGYNVWFRLISVADLLAVRGSTEVERVRRILIRRCVLKAEKNSSAVSVSSLSAETIEKIGEAVREYDAHAELRFHMACPTCGHQWSASFDIVSFFWKELSTRAQHFLREVATIASAYGWSEAEILGMSAEKRRLYLELAG